MNQRDTELASAAISYARAGWGVLPLHSPAVGGCSVGDPAAPAPPSTRARRTGSRTRPATSPVVSRWWAMWPDANIGLATGDGVVVLDVDPDHGGDETLRELEREHGELPVTVEALTGGGGRHLFFATNGTPLRNSAGQLGRGLDIRGDGGYIVAPPSTHASGRRYAWSRDRHLDDMARGALPAWIAELVAAPAARNGSAGDGELIPAGERNTTLTSLAGTMRRHGWTKPPIPGRAEVTNAERCRPPLPEPEVEKIAASVARYQPAQPAGEAATDDDDSFRLVVMSARELCALPDPPATDELLGPLVAGGTRLVLGGGTGEGKTSLVIQMRAAIADGQEFLEWLERAPAGASWSSTPSKG